MKRVSSELFTIETEELMSAIAEELMVEDPDEDKDSEGDE